MALKRIGDILQKEGVISESQLKEALKNKKTDEKLGETLVRLQMTTEMQILKALETSSGVQRISLANFTIDGNVLSLVEEAFCRRNNVIPLRIEGNKLILRLMILWIFL